MSKAAPTSPPSPPLDAAGAAPGALVAIVRLLARAAAREFLKLPDRSGETVILESEDRQ